MEAYLSHEPPFVDCFAKEMVLCYVVIIDENSWVIVADCLQLGCITGN